MQRVKNMKEGFRFGLLLQVAIGPVCLLIFNSAAKYGFLGGLTAVLAVTIVDGLYISLALMGFGVFLKNKLISKMIKVLSALIIIIFGISTVMGVFDKSFLPSIVINHKREGMNVFLQGLLLTASNPLTIVFWSGIFGTKIQNKSFVKEELLSFGLGCVLSTLFFLSGIALLGSVTGQFFPLSIIKILNGLVGGVIVLFGLASLFSKRQDCIEENKIS